MSITIAKDYGYVLLGSTAIAIQCFLSALPVSKLRKSLNVPYPDTGSGRYAKKLTDEEWELFNNAQRAHHNYVEQHTITQVLLLTAGVFNPIYAAYSSVAYIVGRQLYQNGYIKNGPKGRMVGAIVLDLALVALIGMSVHGALKLTQWI
ncbi:hypothetical protein CONCODRAFT_82924 [Conidiobolus coronatus NRRL 28638]|uniref:Membrane-associated proteins in eicosanoid and glutathione metabolism n=1 Tax=Conidiobolus coronatus (strain ATCC 28846 / CBS 209.66 / NRRL 28638) TaxID=796925 RepID=A0A137PHQ3_CONC2|nr:hypothetical protein CONCODRAFT_82924 [Conidiobolus coronatus NRRL 28638]|eukprot:KXN74461.1 hypothetical protein CONCODRAFT_82924 [Conidiobolus coronatus NRRL 28638]